MKLQHSYICTYYLTLLNHQFSNQDLQLSKYSKFSIIDMDCSKTYLDFKMLHLQIQDGCNVQKSESEWLIIIRFGLYLALNPYVRPFPLYYSLNINSNYICASQNKLWPYIYEKVCCCINCSEYIPISILEDVEINIPGYHRCTLPIPEW